MTFRKISVLSTHISFLSKSPLIAMDITGYIRPQDTRWHLKEKLSPEFMKLKQSEAPQ